MKKPRLEYIDRAKGIAILLVVLGHVTLDPSLAGNIYSSALNRFIYLFHVPFFMFLSGFIMYYNFWRMRSIHQYSGFIKKKAKRLLPGLFLVSGSIGVGRVLLGIFAPGSFHADLLRDFVTVLIRPEASYISSIWYVYALFLFCLIMPGVFFGLARLFPKIGTCKLLLPMGVLLHFIPMTSYFALDRIFEYFLVFSLGICCAKHRQWLFATVDEGRYVFLGIFAASFTLLQTDMSYQMVKLVVALSSIPALCALVRSELFAKSGFLAALGKYTFPIYLLNTEAIALTRAAILHVLSGQGVSLFIAGLLLFLNGILIPVFIKTKVLPRFRTLDSIVR